MAEPAPGRPDVTVSVVNASNREGVLALLSSLEPELAGTLEVEVVVLDNASDDDSVAAIESRFPWARVIAQPFRAGFGANHNRVIGETHGRYVLLLSHDAEVRPGALAGLVAYADDHPEVGALAPRLRYPDGAPQASAWRFPSPPVALLATPSLGRLGVVQSLGERARRVDWAMGAALLLRRSALERVGLFDERFFMYSEETDLCLRLARAGFETHFLPSVTVVHHDSALRGTVPHERIAEEWRSRHEYWTKHHSQAGARVAALATGTQHLLRAGIAAALLALPARVRPGLDPSLPARWRLHARSAWFGASGAGLRERAEAWNREHERTPRPAAR